MIKNIDIEKKLFSRDWIFKEPTFEVFPFDELQEDYFQTPSPKNVIITLTPGGSGRYFAWFALIEKPEISFLISSEMGIDYLGEIEGFDTDTIKCMCLMPNEEIVILNIYAPIDPTGCRNWYVGYICWTIVKFYQNNAEHFGIKLDYFMNEAFGDIYLDKDYIVRIHTER